MFNICQMPVIIKDIFSNNKAAQPAAAADLAKAQRENDGLRFYISC
jgi:hypothetical protein